MKITPPRERSAPEVTGGPQQAAPRPARKKPWSKPGFRLVENWVFLTERSPDILDREDHTYYISSF